ncbi:MAG: type II secretion system minor pseudopilin GspK [Pseudomonadota bacterium]
MMFIARKPSDSERGAALLSILMVVAAMSIAALIAVEAIARATRLASITNDRSVAFWYTRSAEAAGSSLVSELLQLTEGRLADNTPWVGAPITFPIDEGVIVAQLDDASNCFNLNALADRQDEIWIVENAQFTKLKLLFEAQGFGAYETDQMAESIADWIDSDTLSRPNGAEDTYYTALEPAYRSAAGPLENVRELLAIGPFTPERYEAVRRLVCVRDSTDQSVLNLNTLTDETAPLLVSLFSEEIQPEVARRLVEDRPLGGWQSVEQFLEAEQVSAIEESYRDPASIDVVSTYFEINGTVSLSLLATRFELLYEVDNLGRGALVWRRYGDE